MHPTGPAQLLDHRAAERLNLAVLKRIDLATEEVLASANHVALYDFDQNSNHWERKDVEGSLFLIRRKVEPFIQIIILNKKSTHNYVEDVHPEFQFEKSRPYLLYRNKDDEVVGIWFYEADEADKVEHLLHRVTAYHAGHADAPAAYEATTAPNGSEDGSFWDLRAPSPPPDFDPFVRSHAEEQQQPLPPHQQQHPAKAQHQQAPLGDLMISLPSGGHQETEEHGVNHIQQQQMQQPAARMCCPISPMSQAGPAVKDTPALGGTPPPCLPSGPLKGVNVLRQGSVMTPEQCNLAELLSNMRVASAGGPNGEGSPQLQPPQGSSPSAAQGQAARTMSAPLQPPALYHSGVMEIPHAQDPEEEDAYLLASHPVLLTPKFLAGKQPQQQGMSAYSNIPSSAAAQLSVKRTTSEPLSVPGLHAIDAGTANNTSLHRFFPRADGALSASKAAVSVREQEYGGLKEKLREALVSLSKSDAFLDMLAHELHAAGNMQL